MSSVYIIGSSSTVFTKHLERSFRDLAREVTTGVLADAGIDGAELETAWFANCGMHAFGQANIRGQACLNGLMLDGVLPQNLPIANVEGGCATGSLAFNAAFKDVLSGEHELSLAVGVEKTLVPDDPMKTIGLFKGGVDQLHPEEWMPLIEAAAADLDYPLALRLERILFLDTYAMQTLHHMRRYGTTARQLACVAEKNHFHGSLNAKAQYRFEVSVEKALADRPVAGPLTRAMCCPVSDGAAAVLLCSEAALAKLPAETRTRAVRVRASAIAGGRMRAIHEPGLTQRAAQRAYARAGLGPADIDVVELHDSTAWCEIAHSESLGFAEAGQGGPLAESGETRLGGRLPINPSGGLISKGHPLAATGLGMIDELVLQLRGEAGARQVPNARIGLQHNAGGLIGFDEALCSVTILDRQN